MQAMASSHEYLRRQGVELYLHDVIQQLLASRDPNPLEFIAEYFQRVVKGDHVYTRPYAFVSATPRNCDGFLTLFSDTFAPLKDDVLTVQDLHSLALSLVPDFPSQPVQDAAEVVSELTASAALTFATFMRVFRVTFFYADFLREASGALALAGRGAGITERELRGALRDVADGWSGPSAVPPRDLLDEAAAPSLPAVLAGRPARTALSASLCPLLPASGSLLPPTPAPRLPRSFSLDEGEGKPRVGKPR